MLGTIYLMYKLLDSTLPVYLVPKYQTCLMGIILVVTYDKLVYTLHLMSSRKNTYVGGSSRSWGTR